MQTINKVRKYNIIKETKIKKSILVIVALTALIYLGSAVFKSSDSGGRIDYKSAIKLDIPPGYTNLSGNLYHDNGNVKQVAALFLKHFEENPADDKWGIKYNEGDRQLIYLLNISDHTIRKREINVSGTLMEYTWRGQTIERLRFAAQNGQFDPPGFSAPESKNLYH